MFWARPFDEKNLYLWSIYLFGGVVLNEGGGVGVSKCWTPEGCNFYLQYLKQETKIVDSFSPPQLPSHSDSILNSFTIAALFKVTPHLKSCISDSQRYH